MARYAQLVSGIEAVSTSSTTIRIAGGRNFGRYSAMLRSKSATTSSRLTKP